MRSPPIRRRPIGGQRGRSLDRIALVDPRKRGPSPFASCGHLRYVGDPSAGSAVGASTALHWSIPVNGAPSPLAPCGHLKFLNRVAARRVTLPPPPRRLTLLAIGPRD